MQGLDGVDAASSAGQLSSNAPSAGGIEAILEVVHLDDRPHYVEHQTAVGPDAVLRVAARSAVPQPRRNEHADEAEPVERVEEVGAGHDHARIAVRDVGHIVRPAGFDERVGLLDDCAMSSVDNFRTHEPGRAASCSWPILPTVSKVNATGTHFARPSHRRPSPGSGRRVRARTRARRLLGQDGRRETRTDRLLCRADGIVPRREAGGSAVST